MSPVCLDCMEFTEVVEGNGDTNDKSIWEGQISDRVADATESVSCSGISAVTIVRAV